jgi:hypothetical protein
VECEILNSFLIFIKDCHVCTEFIYEDLVGLKWSELLNHFNFTEILDVINLDVFIFEDNHTDILLSINLDLED